MTTGTSRAPFVIPNRMISGRVTAPATSAIAALTAAPATISATKPSWGTGPSASGTCMSADAVPATSAISTPSALARTTAKTVTSRMLA